MENIYKNDIFPTEETREKVREQQMLKDLKIQNNIYKKGFFKMQQNHKKDSLPGNVFMKEYYKHIISAVMNFPEKLIFYIKIDIRPKFILPDNHAV